MKTIKDVGKIEQEAMEGGAVLAVNRETGAMVCTPEAKKIAEEASVRLAELLEADDSPTRKRLAQLVRYLRERGAPPPYGMSCVQHGNAGNDYEMAEGLLWIVLDRNTDEVGVISLQVVICYDPKTNRFGGLISGNVDAERPVMMSQLEWFPAEDQRADFVLYSWVTDVRSGMMRKLYKLCRKDHPFDGEGSGNFIRTKADMH